MTIEEKVDRMLEMQYMIIHQINSIVDYIANDDVSIETHTNEVGGVEDGS
jgi:hypothetical protein